MQKTSHYITANNNVRLLLDGKETLSAIKHSLKNARQCINLEYFLISDDKTGSAIKDILIERAESGVRVNVLFDALGSWRLGREFIHELVNAGVNVRRFMPVTFCNLRRIIHRDHRKIITIDGRVGLLGGFNIGDIYLSQWRDTHIMLEGDAVRVLDEIFADMWSKAGRWSEDESCEAGCDSEDESCEAWRGSEDVSRETRHDSEDVSSEARREDENLSSNTGRKSYDKSTYPDFQTLTPNKPGSFASNVQVKILASGTGKDFRAIAEEYIRIISRARHRIWITTPYLVPDKPFMNALYSAASRGADVKIIIPLKSNHTLASWASQSYINELLDLGIRIFTYKDRFIHAKTLMADSHVASVGTANIDALSFGINYEVQAFVYHEHIVRELENVFIADLEHCTEEITADRKTRPILQRVKEKTGRLLSRWL